MSAEVLRVLLVDPGPGLGEALAVALARLGSQVFWAGAEPPPEGLRGLRRIPGGRAALAEGLPLPPGGFDAAVDLGAAGPDGPRALAQALRGRVGLVVQLGTWQVYAGAEDAPDCTAEPRLGHEEGLWDVPPLPVGEAAPKQDGEALAAEDALWQERSRGDYPAAVLRLAALYGPGVPMAREWYVVARAKAGRRRLAVPDGGRHLLHRLFVDNAVHAILAALAHPREVDGHAFNVGDSHVPTAAALCRQIGRALDRPVEPVGVSPADWPLLPWAVPRPVVLDTLALRARLGYAEPVPPEEGLLRTVRWLWDLPEVEVPRRLAPYLARWACAHDFAAEDAALRRAGAVE